MVIVAGGPLNGIRVLDFTRFVSGSYASQLLAGLGAEVLKIEVPPLGDPYRTQGAVRVADESVLFMTLNSGKKSVAIDFRAPETSETMDRLVAESDVIIENGRPGSLEPYGLDYPSTHALHPHIVYGSISGFGAVGPAAGRGGFDLILQAESGLMSVTGHPESGPAKIGSPVTDVGAGLTCVAGINAALLERTKTGTGRHVTTSLLEFALASLSTVATASFVTHDPPGLLGTHSPNFAPYGAFRTADGWIALAGAGSDDLWLRLCSALQMESLVDDSRFVDNAARVRHRAALTDEVERRTRTESVDHWLDLFNAQRVPCARIANLEDAFASEQVEALEMVVQLDTASGSTFDSVGAPMRFDDRRPTAELRAPRLGEHTQEVLVALGTSDTELSGLVAAGLAIT